jgi:hypothetical protein
MGRGIMEPMTPRKRKGRKLLVASIGVAAVSYVACGGSDTSDKSTQDAGSDVVANLIAPPDTGTDQVVNNDVVANLVAPPDTGSDQEADQESDQAADQVNLNDVVANLVAPPDASSD